MYIRRLLFATLTKIILRPFFEPSSLRRIILSDNIAPDTCVQTEDIYYYYSCLLYPGLRFLLKRLLRLIGRYLYLFFFLLYNDARLLYYNIFVRQIVKFNTAVAVHQTPTVSLYISIIYLQRTWAFCHTFLCGERIGTTYENELKHNF